MTPLCALPAQKCKPPCERNMKKILRYIGPILALVLFVFALFVVQRVLRKANLHDIVREIRAIPDRRMWMAMLLTFGSYWAITGYDWLAFRYIRHALPYRRIAFAAFISSAYSNNIGMANLAGRLAALSVLFGVGLYPQCKWPRSFCSIRSHSGRDFC